jgi:hypothetical protein
MEILSDGGNIAFAIRTLITIIASMEYYNQVPIFDDTTTIVQTAFIQAQIPGGGVDYYPRCAGWTLSYIAVFVLVLAHIAFDDHYLITLLPK